MKIPSRLHKSNKKLIKASNALYATYEAFSKDIKKFGFVKKVQKIGNCSSYRPK